MILCTKLSNIKALALTLGPGEKDGVTGNRERGTAMLIKKLIVRLRMWYADVEDTMASVGITNLVIGIWEGIEKENETND